MAEQIPTSIQEEISAEYFDVFLSSGWDVSDQKYRKLLSDCFGKNGKFPFKTAITLPSTPVGLRNRQEWKDSFEKQVLALQQYMISRNIPMTGWKWSRGDGMMGFLNDIAKDRCGVSTLDSWNPMDIVGVQSAKESAMKKRIERDVIKGVDKDINVEMLNGIMIEYVKSKDLMPISLKKINKIERAAFEESDNLKSESAKRKHAYKFTYSEILCDLEWSTYKNEWKSAQELSWSMSQKPSVYRAGVNISVQGRAFSGRDSREKPQHSLSQKGAGAHLGKSSLPELEKFLTQYKVSKVPSPTEHPQIPKKGKTWTPAMKQYWIQLYNTLSTVQINGKKINFKKPGSYGEGTSPSVVYARNDKGQKTTRKLTGFAAALESACEADEKDFRVRGDAARSSGSRLTTKLWALEWLSRYHKMTEKGSWDAFAYRMIKSAKKELSGMGPFIKILGEQGRSAAQKKLRMQKLIEDNPDVTPIYDPALANKKTGVIPDSKKKTQNIIGYESNNPMYDKLFEDLGFDNN